MRSTVLGLVLGGALLWGLGSCGGDPAGACAGASDCGAGQRCDPELGCVPSGSDGDADTDADTDADSDTDADADGDSDLPEECASLLDSCERGDEQACRLYEADCGVTDGCEALWADCGRQSDQACLQARDQGCRLPEDCETLGMLCEMGDDEACFLRDNACSGNPCGADGSCDPECGDVDPDCGQLPDCLELCGELPLSAREWCSWACSDDGECVLVQREPGTIEQCLSADGQDMSDEDCDGRVDCEDLDCANDELCR